MLMWLCKIQQRACIERENNMTNTELLKEQIAVSGMSKTFIAKQMGCSRPRLYKILDGAECTVSEMISLSNILRLSNKLRRDIFYP